MDKHRKIENLVKCAYQGYIGLNGGLNFAKGWVAAEKDIWISAFDGVGAALT